MNGLSRGLDVVLYVRIRDCGENSHAMKVQLREDVFDVTLEEASRGGVYP